MELFETKQTKGRNIPIAQSQILAAWRKVKAAGGSGGVDGKSLSDVESNLRNELYKLETKMPEIRFERYADDIVVHCRSKEEAEQVKKDIDNRLKACLLELHEQKTKIVYCKKQNRPLKQPVVVFNFLGFEFKPRKVKVREGKYTLGFGPG